MNIIILFLSDITGATAQKHPQNEVEKKRKDCAYCDKDMSQSPINIVKGKKNNAHTISFQYNPSHEVVLNLGHTVELLYDKGSKIIFDGKEYQLVQMHFHTPSEHVVQKKGFSMEAHLVHQSEDMHYTVVSILFKEGKENEFIKKFIADIPLQENEKNAKNSFLNISEILPIGSTFYTYSGSLTTPPYTEGVHWVIFQKNIECSKEQKNQILKEEGINARETQNLNHRVVEVFK